MSPRAIRSALAAALLAGAACQDPASPAPLVVGLLAPDSIVVPELDSARIELVLLDSSGRSLTGLGGVVWQIADSSVATIDQAGLVHYRRPGTTTAVALAHGLARSVVVRTGVRFARIASGTEYRGFMRWCGVTRRGALYCLGSGNSVSLGTDTLIPLAAPPEPIRQLSVGYEHVCAVTSFSAGWCWGVNLNGVLGSDTLLQLYQPVMTPVAVGGGIAFSSIDAGGQHSCGVAVGGAVYCWGLHSAGRLGDGDSTFYGPRPAPAPIPLPLGAIAVAAGGEVSCALLIDRSVWCWGTNSYGALGVGQYPPARAWAPVRVASTTSYQSISAGADHVCARTLGNSAECWGSNVWGQLGTFNDVACPYYGGFRCALRPVLVVAPQGFIQVETGGVIGATNGGASCGLTINGQVYCWGANRAGEVGVGNTDRQDAPVPVSGPVPAFASISVGDFHACGLTVDGVAWCWGYGFGLTPTRLPFQY